MDAVVKLMIPIDTILSDLVKELVLCCDSTGLIRYANRVAQQWSTESLEGKPFKTILQPDATEKGQRFFEAACLAPTHNPTPPWDLVLGTPTHYTIATFRGYSQNEHTMLIGQVESAEVTEMQQEMLAITSELSQAQRDLRKQNHALQKLLEEQRLLLQTIQDLTAPAVPIWEGALLVPLVGHIDSQRANKIAEDLLQHVHASQAIYVILDMSGMTFIDTTVAQHLISTAQSIRLLGAIPVMVGIKPDVAETIIHLGVDMHGFVMHSDLHHAIAYVLRHLKRR